MTGTAYFLGVIVLSAVIALFFLPRFRSWVSRSIGGSGTVPRRRGRAGSAGLVADTFVPAFTVRLSSGDRTIRRTPVANGGGTLVVGRANTSDVVVPDEDGFRMVSSRHMLVECESDEVYLTDVSTNGTFRASGERVQKKHRTKVAPGENIFLGASAGPAMIRVERV